MLYAIMATDKPDSLNDRLAARPDHLARLQQLQDQGRLVLAGPHPAVDSADPGSAGFTGSLVVAEFASLDNADHPAQQDQALRRIEDGIGNSSRISAVDR